MKFAVDFAVVPRLVKAHFLTLSLILAAGMVLCVIAIRRQPNLSAYRSVIQLGTVWEEDSTELLEPIGMSALRVNQHYISPILEEYRRTHPDDKETTMAVYIFAGAQSLEITGTAREGAEADYIRMNGEVFKRLANDQERLAAEHQLPLKRSLSVVENRLEALKVRQAMILKSQANVNDELPKLAKGFNDKNVTGQLFLLLLQSQLDAHSKELLENTQQQHSLSGERDKLSYEIASVREPSVFLAPTKQTTVRRASMGIRLSVGLLLSALAAALAIVVMERVRPRVLIPTSA
ncbi:MAG: hypothetical protein HYR96_09180 [Deltaproteobacteria bacterium]|nr:hypothetical protein [Deltaproteobacteria bacterium]MBI3294169.1 hypothetical protein [Deltaproteobacteria bacterium]